MLTLAPLTPPPGGPCIEAGALARTLYRLTDAEVRLARRLHDGETLREACDAEGIA